MPSTEGELSKSERKRGIQKRLITRAARKLFELKSYDDVSMEEIADEAAVSKQTLYNYFSSKDSIYLRIGIEDFKEAMERTNEVSFSSLMGKDLVLKLVGIFFATALDFPLGVDISKRFTIINNEREGIAEKILQQRKEKRPVRGKESLEEDLADYLEQASKYEKYWKDALERGKKDGTITSNLSANQLMYYTYILINGITNQMQLKKKPIMSALKDADLDNERIKEITLRLTENLLEETV